MKRVPIVAAIAVVAAVIPATAGPVRARTTALGRCRRWGLVPDYSVVALLSLRLGAGLQRWMVGVVGCAAQGTLL